MRNDGTPPGISKEDADRLNEVLQQRLNALIDLQLTLKHVHWNVVGPTFIAVHEMLDPQTEAVRAMTDEVAERIATLGGTPMGTPGYVVEHRSWKDYGIGQAVVPEHLAQLDDVYNGVVSDHRAAIEIAAEIDPVCEDLLIDQTGQLELFQWFVTAHLESSEG